MNIFKKNTEKHTEKLPMTGKVKKGYRIYCTAIMGAALILGTSVTAFAAGDPITVINNLSTFMLNQASTDRLELAKLLNISDTQLSYITNVDAGHGLIKVGSSLVPFANKFPKNTKLSKLMTTKPGEGA